MVVCECRKATKLYCFVHSAAVCGECVCAEKHKICVVRTYSEWVIDPDYHWPPKCSVCDEELRADQAVSRLGCLHVLHTACLETHLKSFPDRTIAPGYVCPECGSSLWPPKNFRNLNTGLPLKVKEAIAQAGLAQTLLGGEITSLDSVPAFSGMPLVTVGISDKSMPENNHVSGVSEISAADEPPSTAPLASTSLASTSANSSPSANMSPQQMANYLARKNSYRPDKIAIGHIDDDGEDEDAVSRKYARRGPFYKQLLTHIIPFWSPALPTLPVTNPNLRKDGDEDRGEIHSRRRHHRHSTVDPRNILFFFAILSCVATMLLLYYRLIQSSAVTTTS